MSEKAKFITAMEATEFYRDGKATAGVLTADELQNPASPRHFRYKQAIDPDKLGATAIFELGEVPCIYFKYLSDAVPTPEQLTEWRRLAWCNGLAPMLWVVTPTSISIYNAFAKPVSNDDDEHKRHLLTSFENVAQGLRELNDLAGRLQLETGRFWNTATAKRIDRSQRVDESLLRDLSRAEQDLVAKELPIDAAHSLLGRSIFIAYLQDRKILSPQFFRSHYGVANFCEVLDSKEKTDQLFGWIRQTFNGDLFPLTDAESKAVKSRHLKIVKDLLEGTDATRQMRLWPYRFDVIPVELISSIYEMFTHSADGKIAKERGTHYTPIGLVDLVLSQVFDGLKGDAKVLDMSCGSGVFLVEALRRLVSLRLVQGEKLTRALIRETLYNQVYGIDITAEAVQIAAFSLYLTSLELDPDPQPPSALKFRQLIGKNLFAGDAFDEDKPFNQVSPFVDKGFDAIVGNPPWTRLSSGSSVDTYCNKRNLPLVQQGKPDQAFLWRAGDFCRDNAVIGLIMSGKPFFSHTVEAREARKQLLLRFAPRLLLNLSELRHEGLFPTAIHPAMVCILSGRRTERGDSFILASARRSKKFKAHGLVEISPETTNRLPAERAATDPDMLKIASWGSARDMHLVRRIRETFPTLSDFMGSRSYGQGFQRGKQQQQAPELKGKRFLPGGQMPRFRIDAGRLGVLENVGFWRPRDASIYKGPLVLTTRGIGSAGFYAAMCPTDVVFDEMYYGFSVSETEAHYLNGILNSKLAAYWLFMTSSAWGVERDEVKPIDLLRLPIPAISGSGRKRVEAVVSAVKDCQISSAAELPLPCNRLDKAVYDLYGIEQNEVVFVEDLLSITLEHRLAKAASAATWAPSPAQLSQYAKTLIGAIQPLLAARSGRYMGAEIFDAGAAPLTVIRFYIGSRKEDQGRIRSVQIEGMDKVLSEIEKNLDSPVTDEIFTRRVLRVYAENCVYVVKPSQYRYWCRSAALNDFDAIMAEHLGVEDHGR